MPMDHRARAKEQERLEECVGEEMEHRRVIGADAGGEEHVAELRAGRIGDDLFNVVLQQADGGGEEGRNPTDQRDDQSLHPARIR